MVATEEFLSSVLPRLTEADTALHNGDAAPRTAMCESFEYEVVAAGVSGDLGYIVGFEHTTASVRGAPPGPYSLRVTTIFRREKGEWKVVHRHADPVPESASTVSRLGRSGDEEGDAG